VWLPRSLAVVLTLAFLAGCGESRTYSAEEVAGALRNHGFHAAISKPDPRFTSVFPERPLPRVVPKDVLKTVIEMSETAAYRPGGNTELGDLELEAFIFGKQDEASCDGPNVIGACLRKGNVMVVVRNSRAQSARKALADLN
jgi:hypothetical protein